MKRILYLMIASLLLAGTLAAQSLGDLAREARKNKKPTAPATKVYTNDDLPATTTISVGDASAAPAAAADSSGKTAKAGAASIEDRSKLEAEWRAKFAEQNKLIAQLEREVDVLVRENKLRAATFYADARNRLLDEKKYAEDDRKYQADIAAEQRELLAARDKLENMRQELRRAGLSSSVAD